MSIFHQMVLLSCAHGDIEVWVESDGHRLDEYDHKRVNSTSETCHIPSESGKVRSKGSRLESRS